VYTELRMQFSVLCESPNYSWNLKFLRHYEIFCKS